MSRPVEMRPFYSTWARQQKLLLESICPLTPEQMQLRPAPGQWAIWQLCSNMAGGRLYWLCNMLGEDDLGVSQFFRWGWEDDEDHPRSAGEIVDVLEKTWSIVDACFDRWSLTDLGVEAAKTTDASGAERAITRGWVIAHLTAHEVHHGSEVSLTLRVHGLPTSINR